MEETRVVLDKAGEFLPTSARAYEAVGGYTGRTVSYTHLTPHTCDQQRRPW